MEKGCHLPIEKGVEEAILRLVVKSLNSREKNLVRDMLFEEHLEVVVRERKNLFHQTEFLEDRRRRGPMLEFFDRVDLSQLHDSELIFDGTGSRY